MRRSVAALLALVTAFGGLTVLAALAAFAACTSLSPQDRRCPGPRASTR